MRGLFRPSKEPESLKRSKEKLNKLFDQAQEEIEENVSVLLKRVFLLGILGGICGGALVAGLYILLFS